MKNLRVLHYEPSFYTNAHLNRKCAVRLFNAGFTIQEIANEFPEVFEVTMEKGKPKLGQIYDSIYLESDLKETRFTIHSEVVDKLISEKV